MKYQGVALILVFLLFYIVLIYRPLRRTRIEIAEINEKMQDD